MRFHNGVDHPHGYILGIGSKILMLKLNRVGGYPFFFLLVLKWELIRNIGKLLLAGCAHSYYCIYLNKLRTFMPNNKLSMKPSHQGG